MIPSAAIWNAVFAGAKYSSEISRALRLFSYCPSSCTAARHCQSQCRCAAMTPKVAEDRLWKIACVKVTKLALNGNPYRFWPVERLHMIIGKFGKECDGYRGSIFCRERCGRVITFRPIRVKHGGSPDFVVRSENADGDQFDEISVAGEESAEKASLICR
jgi:hypothetical protein